VPRTLRPILMLALLLSGANLLRAQDSSMKVSLVSATLEPATIVPPQRATLTVTLDIEPPFHIYSLELSDAGLPTRFEISTLGVEIEGKIVEPEPHVIEDGASRQKVHEGKVAFRLPLAIAATPGASLAVKGTVSFMACNDSGCLAPAELAFSAKAAIAAPSPAASAPAHGETASDPVRIEGKAGGLTGELRVTPSAIAPGGEGELSLALTVGPGFHIYGAAPLAGGLEAVTAVVLEAGGAIEPLGALGEPAPKRKDGAESYERYYYHEGTVTFRQRFRVPAAAATGAAQVRGKLDYQACNADGCQNDVVDFRVPFRIGEPATAAAGDAALTQELARLGDRLGGVEDRLDELARRLAPAKPESAPVKPEWKPAAVTLDLPRRELRAGETIDLSLRFTTPEAAQLKSPKDVFVDVREPAAADGAKPRVQTVEAVECTSSEDGKSHEIKLRLTAADLAKSGAATIEMDVDVPLSVNGIEHEMRLPAQSLALDFGLPNLWKWCVTAALAALIALLTPCVFPMIPVTVSFFTKQAEKQQLPPLVMPTVYVLGIIASFVLIGVGFTKILGRDGANFLATNGWLQGAFGVLFVLFSVSLFGVITLAPPSWLMNKAGAVRGKGGVAGTLGMGFLFSLTSFTCTAPLVGSILVFAAESGEWQMPIVGMAVFSAVLALPFFFLALFPKVLSAMPKSGSWMNTVKVTLGFLELGFALKFLGAMDAYFDIGIFTRTSILWMWILLLVMNALYLLGAFQFAHDTKPERIGAIPALIAAAMLLLGLHLYDGTKGTIMPSVLESLLPPSLARTETGGAFGWANRIENDLERATALAREKGVPLMMDFTGFT
jgi:thiol:disulfide interchange protein/DsbC/DsbD-like thiol-disulfide interchange protein